MERSKELSMDKAFLQKLTSTVFANLNSDQFGAEELALIVGMSRSQIHRKLRRINGKSISKFIREIRLKEAHRLLQQGVGTASEIAYQVGFSSPTYFTKCFHEQFGYTPGEAKYIEEDTPEVTTDLVENEFEPISGDKLESDIAEKLQDLNRPLKTRITVLYFFMAGILMLLAAFLVWPYLPLGNKRSEKMDAEDKSIAVRPFKSLSDDPEKQYLADAAMEAIQHHLSAIEDLRVISLTSVEQYRDTDKTSTDIGKELKVGYLLEGSFQKNGDSARLAVKLINTQDDSHKWSNQYYRNWNDIFTVQSEVAQLVAHEIGAIITPREKSLIEKPPTVSLTSYDFYLRGREKYVKFELDKRDRKAMETAEDLFYTALEYDSTYAQAYTGLAWIYKSKHFWKTFLSEHFLDSMFILADIALSFDNQLAEAYVLRGDYYRFNDDRLQAIKEYDKAIKFNPNEWQAYWNKGNLYECDDFVKTIDNYQKAASLQRGSFLSQIYRAIAYAYAGSNFREKAADFYGEALKLDNDSARYYASLGGLEETNMEFPKAIELYKKSLVIDSSDWHTWLRLGMVNGFLGQNTAYLEYMRKYENALKDHRTDDPTWTIWIGHAYWVNGFKERAKNYFDEGLRYHQELLKLQRHHVQNLFIYRKLAAIHAFRGNTDKAFEYLRCMNRSQRFPLFLIKDFKNDPLFNGIRHELEFQEIVKDIETKCEAEHERVRVWLEENEML